MALRTVVAYYSDLSGVEIDGNDPGIQFGLDGAYYEIDLSPEERSALREALEPFISAARTVGKPAAHRRRTAHQTETDNEPSTRILREWAKKNGFDVPARGRVPELVREAYRAAQSHRDVRSIERLLDPASSAG